MRTTWPLLAVFFAILISVSVWRGSRSPTAPPPHLVDEAYFVTSFLKAERSNLDSLLIQERLVNYCSALGASVDEARARYASNPETDLRMAEAIEEFFRKNRGTNFVTSFGQIGIPHTILEERRLQEIFAGGPDAGWQTFHKVYPRSAGFISLSRAGFSRDGSLALIYLERHCGSLCGEGEFHVYEFKEGAWTNTYRKIGPRWTA